MLFLIISFLVVADLLAIVTIGYVVFDVTRDIKVGRKAKRQKIEAVEAE